MKSSGRSIAEVGDITCSTAKWIHSTPDSTPSPIASTLSINIGVRREWESENASRRPRRGRRITEKIEEMRMKDRAVRIEVRVDASVTWGTLVLLRTIKGLVRVDMGGPKAAFVRC